MDVCHLLRKRVDAGGPDAAWLESLRADLAATRAHPHCEVWIDHREYPAIRALIHGDRAFLLHVKSPDDPGTMSRDPEHEGDLEDDEEIDLLSAGGEWDSYPVGLTIPTEDAFRILEWFAAHRSPPEWSAWYDGPHAGPSDPDDD